MHPAQPICSICDGHKNYIHTVESLNNKAIISAGMFLSYPILSYPPICRVFIYPRTCFAVSGDAQPYMIDVCVW